MQISSKICKIRQCYTPKVTLRLAALIIIIQTVLLFFVEDTLHECLCNSKAYKAVSKWKRWIKLNCIIPQAFLQDFWIVNTKALSRSGWLLGIAISYLSSVVGVSVKNIILSYSSKDYRHAISFRPSTRAFPTRAFVGHTNHICLCCG